MSAKPYSENDYHGIVFFMYPAEALPLNFSGRLSRIFFGIARCNICSFLSNIRSLHLATSN